MKISRRDVLRGGVATGTVLAASGLTGFPTIVRAAEPIKVRFANVVAGIGVILDDYMAQKRFDLKHGVDMGVVKSHSSVATYMNELASGAFDLGIGAWDAYYKAFSKGVPIKLVSTMTSGVLIETLANPEKVATAKDLKGKTIAAIAGSGALAMTAALLKKDFGYEVGKDIQVQGVPNPAASMTMLLAGNVDAGISWEPNITGTMEKDPKLKPIYNIGKQYKAATGETCPYFVYAIHNDMLTKHPDVGKRVAAAVEECMAAINANPAEAFALAAPNVKRDPATLMKAYQEGRLELMGVSMASPKGKKMIRDAYAFFAEAEGMTGPFNEDYLIS